MTIPFITPNPGALFPKLGKLARAQIDLNIFAAGTLGTDLANIIAQYAVDAGGEPGGTGQAEAQAISQGLISIPSSLNILGGTIQSIAAQTLLDAVYYDRPLSSNTDLVLALNELIRQMKANSQTVQACTVTCTATAAFSITNIGNGVVVTSVKRSDGLVQENTYPESQVLVCVSDAQPGGGATAGHEGWQWAGELAAPDLWDWQWPLGSGASQSFTTVDAESYNDGFNVLVNGDFENFTLANTPDFWLIKVGSAGVQILQANSPVYTGLSSLEFVGDGATHTAVWQHFADANRGTPFTPQPEQQFAVNGWIYLDSLPAAGVLRVSLVDDSGTIVNDTQGVANSFTINLHTTATTTWVNVNGVFRTPNALPVSLNLRLDLSTPLSAGTNLFLDQFAMAQMTLLYTGGPSLSIFAGSVNFLSGGPYPGYTVSPPDTYLLTCTNDFGSAANNATWQSVGNRLWGLASLDLLLPSSNSPTILDTLI